MTALLYLELVEKFDDLENHIEDLLNQKEILQSIDVISNNKVDFGDLLETYNLLVQEIERLQEELKEQKREAHNDGDFEEEEEETLSSKYSIEHVIKDKDGKVRPIKTEDLDMDKNEGVRKAFKVIYEIQRQYTSSKQYEEK